MLQMQKEVILSLLKDNERENFRFRYLLPYKEFFDSKEPFTVFQCERSEGKENYISLIEQFISKDESAEIFVELYGFEEDHDDIWISAETLIILSKCPLSELKQICYAAEDVFPSSIGEDQFTEDYIIIYKDGSQHLMTEVYDRSYNFYYCWWD